MLIGWIKMNQVVHFCSHTIIYSAKFLNFTIGHFGVPWAPHLPGLPLSVSIELKLTPNNILQKTIQRDESMEQKRRNGRRIVCVCVCSVNHRADCALADQTQTTGTSALRRCEKSITSQQSPLASSRCCSPPSCSSDKRTFDRLTGKLDFLFL